MKRIGLILLLGLAVSRAADAGLFPACTRPCYQVGIPCRDYQYLPSSARAETISSKGSLLTPREQFEVGLVPRGLEGKVLPPLVVRGRVKAFRFDPAEIKVEHCSISRIAVALHEDGHWTLSFVARQNAALGNDPRPPFPTPTPPGKFTEHFLRNQFIVRVNCYGGFGDTEPSSAVDAGKPVLVRIAPEPFWVQRVQPYDFWRREVAPEVCRYFDLIDRVDVSLSYR